ncbi:unnamed protein product [Closterium sp. NIES-64]|nr:unnamed protein product [Closterium sp. NIES-64]
MDRVMRAINHSNRLSIFPHISFSTPPPPSSPPPPSPAPPPLPGPLGFVMDRVMRAINRSNRALLRSTSRSARTPAAPLPGGASDSSAANGGAGGGSGGSGGGGGGGGVGVGVGCMSLDEPCSPSSRPSSASGHGNDHNAPPSSSLPGEVDISNSVPRPTSSSPALSSARSFSIRRLLSRSSAGAAASDPAEGTGIGSPKASIKGNPTGRSPRTSADLAALQALGGCGRNRWVWAKQVGVGETGGCGRIRWVGVGETGGCGWEKQVGVGERGLGPDARILFTPESVMALEKAMGATDTTILTHPLCPLPASVPNALSSCRPGAWGLGPPSPAAPSAAAAAAAGRGGGGAAAATAGAVGLGSDARILFTPESVTALEKAMGARDMALMNPVLVQSSLSCRPFYAILHRQSSSSSPSTTAAAAAAGVANGNGESNAPTTSSKVKRGTILIDLEPILPSDPAVNGAGALHSHKLATHAVSRLQAIPSGSSLDLLFQALVEEIRQLTGYDRVMAYKFHEDEHGEVIAEDRKRPLESYLGLHYPSTDIPKASRILFLKNRIRMICDAKSKPVKVVQERGFLKQPVSLSTSTLRAVHGCHAQYMQNMAISASLCLSIVLRDQEALPAAIGGRAGGGGAEGEDGGGRGGGGGGGGGGGVLSTLDEVKGRRLWGMIVCHHTSPRYVPFPVRSACDFLMQVFTLQLAKELQLQAQQREQQILQLQTQLCHMMLANAPFHALMAPDARPSVRDLVECDGAALLVDGEFYSCGTAPTKEQVLSIIEWIQTAHPNTTGLTIDSLLAAGYPHATSLGDSVCGVAMAQIGESDFILWLRSHVQKQIHWSGAKQKPGKAPKDDIKKMNPRQSFEAFLEVVRHRSAPWQDLEVDAIHSVQIILRDAVHRMRLGVPVGGGGGAAAEMALSPEELDKLYAATFDQLVHFIETASAPILAVDREGCITGWNNKVATLTGLPFSAAIGKSLVDDLADVQSKTQLHAALDLAFQGREAHNIQLRLHSWGTERSLSGPSARTASTGSAAAAAAASATAAAGSTAGGATAGAEALGIDVGSSVILLANTFVSRDAQQEVQGVCFVGQDVTVERVVNDKFRKVKGDYEAIVHAHSSLIPPIFGCDGEWHTLRLRWKVKGGYEAIVHAHSSLIPPIFGCDEFGLCTEWNAAMERVTGFTRFEVWERMLIGDVFGSLCRMESGDAMTKLMIIISKAMAGHEAVKVPFSFLNRQRTLMELLLSVHPRHSADGSSVVGAFCFLHTASLELRQAVDKQKIAEKLASDKARQVAYVREMSRGPLDGLAYSFARMEKMGVGFSGKQLPWVRTGVALETQLRKIVSDTDMLAIEQGQAPLATLPFTMETVCGAVISQATLLATRKGAKLTLELSSDVKTLPLCGDAPRLQQILGGLLCAAVSHTQATGLVKLEVTQKGSRLFRGTTTMAELDIRISHTGRGLPEEIINQMFDSNAAITSTATATTTTATTPTAASSAVASGDRSFGRASSDGGGSVGGMSVGGMSTGSGALRSNAEGVSLSLMRRMLKSMKGEVVYTRETGRCFFWVHVDFPLSSALRWGGAAAAGGAAGGVAGVPAAGAPAAL